MNEHKTIHNDGYHEYGFKLKKYRILSPDGGGVEFNDDDELIHWLKMNNKTIDLSEDAKIHLSDEMLKRIEELGEGIKWPK